MTDAPISPGVGKIQQQVVWVYTHDLDGTAQFYAETLELPLILDQGSCRIFRTSATSFLGVCQVRPGRQVEPAGVVITLVSPDVDRWYEHLKFRGVSLDGPPTRSAQFNVYCFFARDPNGYRIEFQQFLDPRWPVVDPS